MRGSFTRDSFDRSRGYSGVLLQAGRPLVDADFNAQVAIVCDRQRTMMRDLLGSHGGPRDGFAVSRRRGAHDVVWIGAGTYYVDGLLVSNERDVSIPLGAPGHGRRDRFLVYLEVWEQEIGPLNDPALGDPAL